MYVISKHETNAVFVIDEIDYLAELIQKTGKDVLYQITRANERLETGSLTLIGVSNDLTFKERLDPRVISSLSEEEIVFTNYNLDQIKQILNARIQIAFSEGIVEDAALNLCSAMASRESGDARRAIDLLRVAAEIAERTQNPKINEDHVRQASQKIEENKEIDFSKPWLRISMKDIVKKYTGIDFDSFSGDFQEAKQAVKSINVGCSTKTNTMGRLLNEVFEQKVESKLIEPTFIIDYPGALSADKIVQLLH